MIKLINEGNQYDLDHYPIDDARYYLERDYEDDQVKRDLLKRGASETYVREVIKEMDRLWEESEDSDWVSEVADYFDEGCHGKKVRKGRKGLKKESESMMPDYTENGSYCILCYNELDADFGYDPGPQIVEDNLTQEYAEARAEELNASSEPFIQYWAERERERYW